MSDRQEARSAAQDRLAALREVDNVEWMKEVEAQLKDLRERLDATPRKETEWVDDGLDEIATS